MKHFIIKEPYLEYFNYELENEIPRNSRMIASDDVFNFMLKLRAVNQEENFIRKELSDEYNQIKPNGKHQKTFQWRKCSSLFPGKN